MNDDGSGEDLPIIDVRSPAERWTDSGRDGLGQLQQRLRDSNLDIAAAAWMVFLLGFVGLQVYSGLRSTGFGAGSSRGWDKATIIATTGGTFLSFGAVIGIALAFAYATRPARVALWAALVAGSWVVLANVVGIAVAFHDEGGGGPFITFTRGTEDKVVQALIAAMEAGLGIVVVVIAYSVLSAQREPPSEPEIADLD